MQISGDGDNQTINDLEADSLDLESPIVTPVQIQSTASPASTTIPPLSPFKEEASLPGDSDPFTSTLPFTAEPPRVTTIPAQGDFVREFRLKVFYLPEEVEQPVDESVN